MELGEFGGEGEEMGEAEAEESSTRELGLGVELVGGIE